MVLCLSTGKHISNQAYKSDGRARAAAAGAVSLSLSRLDDDFFEYSPWACRTWLSCASSSFPSRDPGLSPCLSWIRTEYRKLLCVQQL